ncbi:NfeD family protein [Roseomonas sp. CCTCC AB2023176]|uniref:NfeD family protein n=1 Tax=Roseomonas sp. CCTCC AB2023176 TaxID=3342640 RepID=UPI0035DDDE7E
MDRWLIWVLAGLVLLGAELLLPGVFLLWAGFAALGTGLVVLGLDPGFPLTVGAFVLLLAGGIAVALRLRQHGGRGRHGLNTPESGLVGRDGVVQAWDGPGVRVRVGDSDWAARHDGAVALTPGETVRVEAVEGTTLRVRRPV